MRKETFFAVRVLEAWKNVVSDDYALAHAVHAAGLRIAFAPGALAPCLETTGARRFLSWSRRQALLTRIYRRRLWLEGLLAHAVYCAGMGASIAAMAAGSRLAGAALLAQLLPGMVKGHYRVQLARAALPEYRPWFQRHAWAHVVLVPLATWIWLIALVSAAFGNTIEWRGRRYDLKNP